MTLLTLYLLTGQKKLTAFRRVWRAQARRHERKKISKSGPCFCCFLNDLPTESNRLCTICQLTDPLSRVWVSVHSCVSLWSYNDCSLTGHTSPGRRILMRKSLRLSDQFSLETNLAWSNLTEWVFYWSNPIKLTKNHSSSQLWCSRASQKRKFPVILLRWPLEGIMKFFMHALIPWWPPGNWRSEGEKRCIRKMIGGKKGKFGEQDKVRTVGMATVPKLKRRAIEIFVGDRPSVGTNFHKSGCWT